MAQSHRMVASEYPKVKKRDSNKPKDNAAMKA
jgi:hypothetical protein